MNEQPWSPPPQLVVFEGVDGVGKSALSNALTGYYRRNYPSLTLFSASFPGSAPGSIGEWVYRLHHGEIPEIPTESVSVAALQLLHIASHVDAVQQRIAPCLYDGGTVILDRFWWSTYAYARPTLTTQQSWGIVGAERPFWHDLPSPVVIYLTREVSLKQAEIDHSRHASIDAFYREVIAEEVRAGTRVHEVLNNGTFGEAWLKLLTILGLPPEATDR